MSSLLELVPLVPRRNRVAELTIAWGIVSAGLMCIGYTIYTILFFTGGVVPNATSWCLWAIGGSLEAWSYFKIVKSQESEPSDIAFVIPASICAVSAIIIAALGILFGKFEPPTEWEWYIAAMDVTVLAGYVITKAVTKDERLSSRIAGVLMLIDIFMSFTPILISTWTEPGGEDVLPWTVWTCSYFLVGCMGMIQIQKTWEERRWLIGYPLLSVLLHGGVALLSQL